MKKKICLFLVFLLMASWLYPQSITNIDPQEQQQKQKDLEFQLWQEKLDKAEKEKKKAQRVQYVGLATTSAGALIALGALLGKEREGTPAIIVVGIVTAVSGLAIGIIGSKLKSNSELKIDELTKEGERKGFVTYSYNPATQTIYIGYRITF